MREILESELEKPFLHYLNSVYQVLLKNDTGDSFFHAEIIADNTGAGKWTTPDLVAVSYWRPSILPKPEITVRTFELKRASNCDLASVHQTLAHSRFADFVYLAAPFDDARCTPSKRKEVEKQCAMNGVGLFWLMDPLSNPQSVRQPLRAARKQPNKLGMDRFLEEKLSDAGKEKIRSWGRNS